MKTGTINRSSRYFSFLLIVMMVFCLFTGCGNQEQQWRRYYNDAVDVLGDYPHIIKVGTVNEVKDDWTEGMTQNDWDGVLGLTIAYGYYTEVMDEYKDTSFPSQTFIDFIHIVECRVYIITPNVSTIFHEMVHVWDNHHYGIVLTERETSYLAWLLMKYKGYHSEASTFFNESYSRNDMYSFKHMTPANINYVTALYSMIVGGNI